MISIFTVTFNSQHVIVDCLFSIGRIKSEIEIFVVDNASQDKTCKIIRNKFPYVRLYKNKKNIGFAAAVNQGAKIAKGDYLLFLNPDTVVKTECIEEMVSFLKKRKDAAAVGCKILNPDDSLQPSCGNFPTISNIILDRVPILNTLFRTELIRQESFYSKEQTPDWISGVFLMTKRDVFEKLGGFDEKYFMYGEDIDFCFRAKRLGYNIYYYPKAEIIHFDQGKSPERKHLKALNMRKGFSIFLKKYKHPYNLLIWKLILRVDSVFKPHLRNI